MQRALVQSLIELRSHLPCGVANKLKNNNNKENVILKKEWTEAKTQKQRYSEVRGCLINKLGSLIEGKKEQPLRTCVYVACVPLWGEQLGQSNNNQNNSEHP